MLVPPEAAHQCGAFTRRQARAAGISRDTIRRRLADGRWQQLTADVFAAAAVTPSATVRAWTGFLATGGVVAYRTAAELHGIAEPDSRIHVISRVRLHVAAIGIQEHRVRLAATDVEVRDGLPLTTRLRTLVDLLGSEPPQHARTLLFRAVQQQWIDRLALDQQIHERNGMDGNVQLRELSTLLGTGAHSVAERKLHEVLAGIDGVTFHANVPLDVGGERFVVDVLLPEHSIVIEVDGRRFHSDAERFQHDRQRQNRLMNAGYAVLRFTWFDLTDRPSAVRRDVVEAVAVSSDAKTRRTGP